MFWMSMDAIFHNAISIDEAFDLNFVSRHQYEWNSLILSISFKFCSPICTKRPWEVLILLNEPHIFQLLVYIQFDTTSKFCNDLSWSLWILKFAFLAIFNGNWAICMFFVVLFTLWVILVFKSVGPGNSAIAETLTASI